MLHEAVVRHATLLCERELERRGSTRAVREATRTVTFAVAQWLADSAAGDKTVRRALEETYLRDQLVRGSSSEGVACRTGVSADTRSSFRP
jgi:hypothetical protein